MEDKSIGILKRKANFVAWLHFLWILVVIISLPLILVFEKYKNLVFIIVLINIFSWLIWRDCPLLKWENDLRKQYNLDESYKGTFISHYLKKVFKIRISTVLVRILVYTYILLLIIVALI